MCMVDRSDSSAFNWAAWRPTATGPRVVGPMEHEMPNPDYPVDPALSLKEVRRVTGRGSTSLYSDIKSGRLKTFLNGSRRYARASDVEAYLAARQAENVNDGR